MPFHPAIDRDPAEVWAMEQLLQKHLPRSEVRIAAPCVRKQTVGSRPLCAKATFLPEPSNLDAEAK